MTIAADSRFFCANFAVASSETPARPLTSATRRSANCRETWSRMKSPIDMAQDASSIQAHNLEVNRRKKFTTYCAS
jgi:hypothetical protein